MSKIFIAFLCFACHGFAQIQFNEKQSDQHRLDLGMIPEAFEIKGDVVIKNTSAKKIFLMRADAEKGLRVFTSKKTLLPNDTALLVISFNPQTSGNFSKKINLVTSDRDSPYEFFLSGNLGKIKNDDKTACYYFGNWKNSSQPVKDLPVVVTDPKEKRDNSNRMPDPGSSPTPTFFPPEKKVETNTTELSLRDYKPNNILFLVDVSGSMKDSLKLPLMKNALHTLIEAVRTVDRISLVTYADSVIVLKEAASGADKSGLYTAVDALKAKGLTKGNKAILFSQQLAQKHFIAGGNNQIFLATDGKFRFNQVDFKAWIEHQQDKKIILSTVAFGDDREAIKNLKEIAERGEGSFIQIKKRNGSQDKLLEEIKERSRSH